MNDWTFGDSLERRLGRSLIYLTDPVVGDPRRTGDDVFIANGVYQMREGLFIEMMNGCARFMMPMDLFFDLVHHDKVFVG